MKFCINTDCLDTYGVEKSKNSEVQLFTMQGGVHMFEQIRNGLHTKFECLKVTWVSRCRSTQSLCDVLNSLDSTKFSEILSSNATQDKGSTHPYVKVLKFRVRAIFNL